MSLLHLIERISHCEVMVFCAMASLLFIPSKNILGLKGAFASESLN